MALLTDEFSDIHDIKSIKNLKSFCNKLFGTSFVADYARCHNYNHYKYQPTKYYEKEHYEDVINYGTIIGLSVDLKYIYFVNDKPGDYNIKSYINKNGYILLDDSYNNDTICHSVSLNESRVLHKSNNLLEDLIAVIHIDNAKQYTTLVRDNIVKLKQSVDYLRDKMNYSFHMINGNDNHFPDKFAKCTNHIQRYEKRLSSESNDLIRYAYNRCNDLFIYGLIPTSFVHIDDGIIVTLVSKGLMLIYRYQFIFIKDMTIDKYQKLYNMSLGLTTIIHNEHDSDRINQMLDHLSIEYIDISSQKDYYVNKLIYDNIVIFYGDRVDKYGIHLINKVNEYVLIWGIFHKKETSKKIIDVCCASSLIMDEDLYITNINKFTTICKESENIDLIVLCIEYRNIINQCEPSENKNWIDNIRLSPLVDVNCSLEIYIIQKYIYMINHNAIDDQYSLYFNKWFEILLTPKEMIDAVKYHIDMLESLLYESKISN